MPLYISDQCEMRRQFEAVWEESSEHRAIPATSFTDCDGKYQDSFRETPLSPIVSLTNDFRQIIKACRLLFVTSSFSTQPSFTDHIFIMKILTQEEQDANYR
jgi:hypothetical protein